MRTGKDVEMMMMLIILLILFVAAVFVVVMIVDLVAVVIWDNLFWYALRVSKFQVAASLAMIRTRLCQQKIQESFFWVVCYLYSDLILIVLFRPSVE